MSLKRTLFIALIFPGLTIAAVVGTNPPAQPLTAERIATLPAAQQTAWRAYLARSQQLHEADVAFFIAELKANHITNPTTPPEGRGNGGLSLNHPPGWFTSEEARKLADNVLSFQTPAGGWSKNMNFSTHARQPGERFAAGNAAPVAQKPDDNDAPRDVSWHYVGTFDNDATITQLRFLARLCSSLDEKLGAPYRPSFLRGLDYALAAQFPNGGWPQVYPLEGGYHDAITYNDNAMINILGLMRDIAQGAGDFAFVPAEARTRAGASVPPGTV